MPPTKAPCKASPAGKTAQKFSPPSQAITETLAKRYNKGSAPRVYATGDRHNKRFYLIAFNRAGFRHCVYIDGRRDAFRLVAPSGADRPMGVEEASAALAVIHGELPRDSLEKVREPLAAARRPAGFTSGPQS